MAHQIPIYLPSSIQEVSLILQGSLRLSIKRDAVMSAMVLPTMTVRHGLTNGVAAYTLLPLLHGVRSDDKITCPF